MTVTEYVEGEGSGYTVRVDVLDPEEDPELADEGYHSPTPLYVIFTGGEVYANYDRHSLVRSLPGFERLATRPPAAPRRRCDRRVTPRPALSRAC